MQRSGNHAVIGWWRKHLDSWEFRNNILGTMHIDKAAQNEHGGTPPWDRIDSWENYIPRQIKIHQDSEELIIVIRDPWNWWASWCAYPIPNPNVQHMPRVNTINMYLRYAEYAREHPGLVVNFNKWFADAEYRRTLERGWGLRESDAGLNSISSIGSGSTFDGQRFQNNAQQMKVLTRYKAMASSPGYLEGLRQYPELQDVSRELFDMEPPKELRQ
jgi:hypothetical protein